MPHQLHRRTILRALAGAGLAALGASASRAQTRGATLLVVYPFAAGGTADGLGRLVVEEMAKALDMRGVFENKGGGGGRIGIKSVVAAPADGSTLLIAPMGPMAIQPSFHDNLGFDPQHDLKPVSQLATFDLAISVAADNPARTLADLMTWAKANPAKASVGVPGAGGLPHFFTFMLGEASGVKLEPVVYRGSGAALNDLVAGHLPILITAASESVELHAAGKTRILATSGAQRSPFAPDVPTFREAGYAIEGEGWYGLFAPGATPDAIVERYGALAREIVQRPDIRKRIESFGAVPTGTTPARMAQILREDTARWKPAIVASGFKSSQ